MVARCLNPGNASFKSYGAVGITVCERWLNSFENFLADMGPRPSKDHSIDRIKRELGYAPGNCRWATRVEQNRNKINNRLITYNGETLTHAEWSYRLGLHPDTVGQRLRNGWTVERALTQPIRWEFRARLITHAGETLTLTGWARRLGISPETIAMRIKSGWPIEKALGQPARRYGTSA
jgi:hypothetical protein